MSGPPREFPGASYDHWKTTDPRDYGPEEPRPEKDPDQAYDEWRDRRMEEETNSHDSEPQQCGQCGKLFRAPNDPACNCAERANFAFSGSFQDEGLDPIIVRDIIVTFIHPPIPDRRFDWQATRSNYEPGHLMGFGKDEVAAVVDLISKEDDYEQA